MDGFNMSNPTLPPGFRFHPTDQELIIHYLKKKFLSSSNPVVSIIAEVDIYKFNPWDLPAKAYFGESEWFFFSPRDRKYPNGARPNRAAGSGYWKATGTDKPILSIGRARSCLGVKKALVFYKGRPPKGDKTNWMMLEYRLLDDTFQSQRLKGSMRLDDWVLCRVRQKNKGPNQRQGENYYSPISLGGCLQGQEVMKMNNTFLQGINHGHYLMAPLVSEEADDHQQVSIKEYQNGSPDYSISAVDSISQTPIINGTASSFKDTLESIKKILSINALDEMVTLPQNQATSFNYDQNESVFRVSSPPSTLPYPQCFSEI